MATPQEEQIRRQQAAQVQAKEKAKQRADIIRRRTKRVAETTGPQIGGIEAAKTSEEQEKRRQQEIDIEKLTKRPPAEEATGAEAEAVAETGAAEVAGEAAATAAGAETGAAGGAAAGGAGGAAAGGAGGAAAGGAGGAGVGVTGGAITGALAGSVVPGAGTAAGAAAGAATGAETGAAGGAAAGGAGGAAAGGAGGAAAGGAGGAGVGVTGGAAAGETASAAKTTGETGETASKAADATDTETKEESQSQSNLSLGARDLWKNHLAPIAQYLGIGLIIVGAVGAFFVGYFIMISFFESTTAGRAIVIAYKYGAKINQTLKTVDSFSTANLGKAAGKALAEQINKFNNKNIETVKEKSQTDPLQTGSQKQNIQQSMDQSNQKLQSLNQQIEKLMSFSQKKWSGMTEAEFKEIDQLKQSIKNAYPGLLETYNTGYQQSMACEISGAASTPNQYGVTTLTTSVSRTKNAQGDYVTPRTNCHIALVNQQISDVAVGDVSANEDGTSPNHFELYQEGKDYQLWKKCAVSDNAYNLGCEYNQEAAIELVRRLQELGASKIIGGDPDLTKEEYGLINYEYNEQYSAFYLVHIPS